MLLKTQTRRQFGTLLGAILLTPSVVRPVQAHEASQVHTVEIRAFKFDPPEIKIATCDTVEWTNHDIAPHTATGVDFDWDTGNLEKGMTNLIMFDAPGVYEYFCAFHPHMKARVIVSDPV